MSDHFVPNPPPPHFSSIDGPKQYSLLINSDSLESLGLTALQRINKGNILFYENLKLCYVAKGMWNSTLKQPVRQTVEFYRNKDQQECSKYLSPHPFWHAVWHGIRSFGSLWDLGDVLIPGGVASSLVAISISAEILDS